MNADERRRQILLRLGGQNTPVPASALASELGVSRQIIVGDVSLLRANGHGIQATSRGYLLQENGRDFPYTGTLVCRHNASQLEEELNTIVDYGGTCIDVVIDHSVYGEISGTLDISSRYDVKLFLDKVGRNDRPLSSISGGLHMHHIGAPSKEIFDLIAGALDDRGILVK